MIHVDPSLVQKHKARLKEIEAKADKALDKLVKECPDNYHGKVLMLLALALGVRRMCAITPGVSEKNFVEDAKSGAALWVDFGEPTGMNIDDHINKSGPDPSGPGR